ncbi:(2Fe-2S) ferredoxin domain-containing protein [Halarsenatibacter silvermanii]|uniref:NADP-reducing hydrogenase subunit HndB n=1 Tax=Halarsenatibacter silvermanii TaxID=321763 RepID=A0A1G9QLI0_9FIRM|nr:(2Fe-2S) ferredoxin domain-containing protein [Halarsenatibacter silvermanii]SDM11884.1 NADP-reducing hydrogenase subunit HndB [Halarsenatibacter silvermanii]
MKSLDELRELRKEVKEDLKNRSKKEKPEIIIGMGTCGISAGAREILKTVLDEIKKRDLDIAVTQTGCIGMCEKEPLLDVKLPDQSRITYGHLDPEDVQKIIVQHVINGEIVEELALARLED